MDQDRLSGTAKNLGGKIEEDLGRATGDTRTQVRGQMKQAEGKVTPPVLGPCARA